MSETKKRRSIRLKEWDRSTSFSVSPSGDYISGTDGSILKENFIINTDENGFMTSAKVRGSGNGDVIILGDSVVECFYNKEEERLHRYVERTLDARGLDLRVLGGGMSGSTCLHTLHIVTAKILALRPKLTVILNGVMDVHCARDSRSFWSRQDYLDPFVYYEHEDTENRSDFVGDMQNRLKLLRSICFMLKEFDLPVALATFHHRRWQPLQDPWVTQIKDHPESEFHIDLSLRYQANEATREASRNFSLPLFDIERRFAGRFELLYDINHLNRAGSFEVGTWLGGQIADSLSRPTRIST